MNTWYADRLVCPNCRSSLLFRGNVTCSNCEFSNTTFHDLRLQAPAIIHMTFSRLPSVDTGQLFSDICVERPKVIYKGPPAIRDSKEFMSVLCEICPSPGNILDLGCGPRDQAIPIEYLGHRYVGFDYTNEKADFLADAHSIPFADATFDCVFSYAVFEHLHNPFIALAEVSRVLKPGGYFLGGLSQGEPFHQSYFHCTPWGLSSLIYAIPGLTLKRMWPSVDTLKALSRIGRYPFVIRSLLRRVDSIHRSFPFLAPRKMRWSRHEKCLDELYRAGSLCFCIRKSG